MNLNLELFGIIRNDAGRGERKLRHFEENLCASNLKIQRACEISCRFELYYLNCATNILCELLQIVPRAMLI